VAVQVGARDFVLLVLAGIGGGLTGSIAGLASLVSYPALLAAGLAPVSANVTNTIALIFQGIGNALGSRPELRGQGRLVGTLLLWSVPGGIVGGVLLLRTPSGSFAKVVPWLIAGAAVAVLLRPRSQAQAEIEADPALAPAPAVPPVIMRLVAGPGATTRMITGGIGSRPPLVLLVGTFLVSIYGGYFGAAAGVLMLALFLHFTEHSLARVSALRGAVLSCANAVAAGYFALFGPVDWAAAAPLAIGFLIGGRLGPIAVRHTPATPLRILIAAAGVGLAVYLAASAYF
jgi:uncharacterized membrane protein YfcA